MLRPKEEMELLLRFARCGGFFLFSVILVDVVLVVSGVWEFVVWGGYIHNRPALVLLFWVFS